MSKPKTIITVFKIPNNFPPYLTPFHPTLKNLEGKHHEHTSQITQQRTRSQRQHIYDLWVIVIVTFTCAGGAILCCHLGSVDMPVMTVRHHTSAGTTGTNRERYNMTKWMLQQFKTTGNKCLFPNSTNKGTSNFVSFVQG
jgi:lauroyl/myristoyl acyltransferase